MTLQNLQANQTWGQKAIVVLSTAIKKLSDALTSLSVLLGYSANAYIEGTFTPEVEFGGATTGITYTTNTGTYTRIGRIAFIEINITLSSKGSAVGNARVRNLPFTAADLAALSLSFSGFTAGVGDTFVEAVVVIADTDIALFDIAAGNAGALTDADFTNTTTVRLSGVYRIS